ncbi:MAG: 4Fe-4S binding protein [Thermodesulfobacteriota bacterium]|nr:4Fe-4S binding protein [Thermodesulfobacteriota bacterium]
MRTLRRISQTLFLLIFIFLFVETEYSGTGQIPYPVKFFLDVDPLISISQVFASHGIPPGLPKGLAWSLVLVFMTCLLGRFFCGWVCPLGTLNHIIGKIKWKSYSITKTRAYSSWQKGKYCILIGLLVASLFTLQLVGFVDPLSFLIRSLTISINPVFNYMTNSLFLFFYKADMGFITSISEIIYTFLKDILLSFNQPYFKQGFFIGLIFLVILTLNTVRSRFFCRFICPLGALLGFLSRYSVFSLDRGEDCNSCGKCLSHCQGAASPGGDGHWKKSECLFCWNCESLCPLDVIHFRFQWPFKSQKKKIDLTRRHIVVSALGGLVAVPLIKLDLMPKNPNPKRIRPPGALSEEEFLKRCVKCGECMKVCLTNGLHPSLMEAGIEGIWSPLLIPKLGYCEYSCTLCGQVCPTGAIKELTEEEKKKTKIGLAFINKSRCLPYAFQTSCIVCEEHCPTSPKAIWFEEKEIVVRDGSVERFKLPHVDPELCIGCGICENKCPIFDTPAIFITSIGESRSKKARILL